LLGSFDYVRPRTIVECIEALGERPDAAILAGGTDLFVDLRNAVRHPACLIDIKRIDALTLLDVDGSSAISIGASVSLNRILENPSVRTRFAGLAAAAESIATYQLRNRATLVGNICNASPAADMAPILLVLGAEALVMGGGGERTIPLARFFAGVKRNALDPGELVISMRIPIQSGLRTGFAKQQRIKGHDLAVANAAGAYSPQTDVLRLAVGSCAPTPVLLEPLTVGCASAPELVESALQEAGAAICPIDDVRSSSAYRNAVVPVLLRRLIEPLISEKEGS